MIKSQPIIKTKRLVLRPFQIDDAEEVQALAGDKRIYDTTLLIPHPYGQEDAVKWISTHAQRFYNGDGVDFAITLHDGTLVGAIGFGARQQHKRAELGYWIGVPHWNKGYCSEAAIEVVDYGFRELDYHKITARYQKGNEASGRVMEKLGMLKEGKLVDEVCKDGVFHTTIVYGLIGRDK